MSKVMTENRIVVHYEYSQTYISKAWIETGKFIGYGAAVELECDTSEKRAMIVALGWHEDPDRVSSRHQQEMRILDKWRERKPRYHHEYDDHMTYDHELTVDEIWKEISRMVAEKQSANGAVIEGA